MDKHAEATEHLEHDANPKIPRVDKVHHPDPELYIEALERYPNDDTIDQAQERRLVRKLDMRILPLLGVCYFFYVRQIPTLMSLIHFVKLTRSLVCR